MCLANRYLAMNVYSYVAIPAGRCHVTLSILSRVNVSATVINCVFWIWLRFIWILTVTTKVIHFTNLQHTNSTVESSLRRLPRSPLNWFDPSLSVCFLTVRRLSLNCLSVDSWLFTVSICFLTVRKLSQSQSYIATDGRSISKSWCRAPSGAHDQIFIIVWQLRSCFCGAPSLTRGRVCLLYMLLGLASAVFLGFESLGSRDHILLSQFGDFPFRRLLWLAGSRWRYSTPPPHASHLLKRILCRPEREHPVEPFNFLHLLLVYSLPQNPTVKASFSW
jgi:hypothetical protein